MSGKTGEGLVVIRRRGEWRGVSAYGEPLLGVAHSQVGVVLPVADLG